MKKIPTNYLLILVASLGYFVDAYDLILFVVVRNTSLIELGVAKEFIVQKGLFLFNVQMAGLLIGGILFGILGDKKGRLSVLFGSILLYSLANLLNGFVQNMEQYAILRFIAGIGLAGELGAGITLVSETIDKEKRGYGTMIVAASGAFGAVFAALVGDLSYWRVAYFVGAGMGFCLLFLRIGTFESKLYNDASQKGIKRGNFVSLFNNSNRLKRYCACIAAGIPIFFVVAILMQLAPEVAKSLNVDGKVTAGNAVMYVYGGLTLGDVCSSWLSQKIRSRKKSILCFQILSAITCLLYLNLYNVSNTSFFVVCFFMGISAGYWVTLITTATEQFGTNLRSTVTTSIPNLIRGAAIPISLLYQNISPKMGVLAGASLVGLICFSIAIFATTSLEETFARDLDFLE